LGGTGTTTTTNTWVKLYGSYVSDDPIRCFEIRGSGGDVSGEIFYIDQISIKEVGVAAGWTTADAEPLIPQTALMGMSKPMVFNGIDEHVVLDSTLVLASTDGEMSVSCWVVIDDVADASYRMIIGGTHPNLFAYCGYYHNKFKWLIDGVWNTSSRSIVASTLYHLVYTKNNTSYKFYINGSLEWSITGAGVLADMNKIGDSPNYEEHEGIINEVSAWNKELSLAQVQELFNDGVALDARTHSLSPSTGTDNLIGYWRNVGLGEWEDLSQNTNDGTPTNATDTILLPEGTTAGKDLLGFPLTVPNNGWLNITDGELNNKSLVVIPNSSVFDFTSGSFTVSFWLKPLWTKSGYNFIISKGGYLVHNGWEFRTHEDQIYQPEFTVWEDDGTRRRATSGTITYNEWVYLVGIYDISVPATYLYKVTGADTITTLATNTAVSGNISTDTRNIIIGSGSVTGWQASLGKQQFSIDEVKIYNRALEPEEITKNYKHGKSKHKN